MKILFSKYACGLAVVALWWSATSIVTAGKTSYTDPDRYAYYDIWWMEHMSDRETKLLLHFNQPRSPLWARPGDKKLAARKKAQQPEDDLLGQELLGGLDAADSGGGLPGLDQMTKGHAEEHRKKLEQAEGRYRDAKAPEGVIYDYSPNLKRIRIPAHVQKVDGGRFGKALKLSGKTGIRVNLGSKGGGQSMEGWFKVAELPDKTACLLASGQDGTRLLLHPDGHLELVNMPEDEKESPTSMRTDKPIPVGEWIHVACYTWIAKHIEWVGNSDIGAQTHRRRISINGRIAAEIRAKRIIQGGPGPMILVQSRDFYVGMNPDGKQVFNGLVDEVRVASMRRYNTRPTYSWRDAEAKRPIPFGPPHFRADARVFHASFESRDMTVHPKGKPTLEWNLGEHADFSDYQRDGIYGKALLIDPVMGFPRIPIQGFSPKEGTFELWFQPVNWDSHTDFGKIKWGKHTMTLARFMGRDRKTGKIVPFMEFQFPRATIHGVHDWIHPGTWFHFIWTWSSESVYKQDGAWGSNPPKKGDPLHMFRATREGENIYKAILKRDVDLLDRIEPLYLELGISDDITVYHGQRPAILVDEVIGHNRAFSEQEILNAPKRWKNELPVRSE